MALVKMWSSMQPFITWFQRVTAGMNWYRLAFIFLPAAIRGDIMYLSFFLPFLFGPILQRVVRTFVTLYDKTDNIKCVVKVPRAEYISFAYNAIGNTLLVWAFLAFCHWNKNDTRVLGNFYLSSFLVPMIRHAFPQTHRGPLKKGVPMWDSTWGDSLANVFIFTGLCAAWLVQGLDQLFLGFLFLLAIPTIQDKYWFKPTQHMYLVLLILACCMPFLSVGICSRFFPDRLESFPKAYYKVLCSLSNVKPRVKDYYAILGVDPEDDQKAIKRVFRKLSVELHPDKVGDDQEKLARFNEVREASDMLTKKRAEYDKSIENQEQDEMSPRCEMFMYMMHMWVVYALLDWVQVEESTEASKKALKTFIASDRADLGSRMNLDAIGLSDSDESAITALREISEKQEEYLPVVQGRVVATGTKEDIYIIRDLLTSHGVEIKQFPQVTGKIKGMQQQIVLLNNTGQRDLTTQSDIYTKWQISVEGIDIMSDEQRMVTATSTIVSHTYSEGRHIITCDPDLGTEFEMGTSKATLSPPKGTSGDKATATVGFHIYPALQQVMSVGDLMHDKYPKMPPLSETDDFYSGYKFEIWEGDTLLAQQRVHEYVAKSHTFVLKGALSLTGAKGKVEAGSQFVVFPDQLLPQLRDSITPRDVKKGGA